MKFNCGFKSVWFMPLLIGGLAFIVIPLALHWAPPSEPPSPAPRETPQNAVPPAEPPAAAPNPRAPVPADPLLRRWQTAIRQHDAKGVLDAQTAFLEREADYREPLGDMAKEDADPRIRAFCVAVLGRMKSPPPEEFFIDRLADSSEHPRTSALHALERVGSAACLTAVDRLASADPAEGVPEAAAKTAKAVRSR